MTKNHTLLFFILMTVTNNAFSSDCIVLKNYKKLCGEIEFKSKSHWVKNDLILDDSIRISLSDVNKINYDGQLFLRVKDGDMLSDFAVLIRNGRIKIYEKNEAYQFGINKYYNGRHKYFSVDQSNIKFLNLTNLRNAIPLGSPSRKYLDNAHKNKLLSIGLRTASVIPFVIGVSMAQKNESVSFLVPFGIGFSMIVFPTVFIKPLINKDIENTISSFNKE